MAHATDAPSIHDLRASRYISVKLRDIGATRRQLRGYRDFDRIDRAPVELNP